MSKIWTEDIIYVYLENEMNVTKSCVGTTHQGSGIIT